MAKTFYNTGSLQTGLTMAYVSQMAEQTFGQMFVNLRTFKSPRWKNANSTNTLKVM